MSKDLLNPEKALIFRIVHRNNLDDVLSNGCRCRNDAADHKYVEIGNQELIQRRNGRTIPCAPGGTLSDYVPFYFTPYSPMLYNIKNWLQRSSEKARFGDRVTSFISTQTQNDGHSIYLLGPTCIPQDRSIL
jgi:hypothetical protein